MLFRLSEKDVMDGNDFIIFKHGCGTDSEYTMKENNTFSLSFSDESKTKMKKHCEGHIFYHVEVEFIGKSSNAYEFKKSEDSPPIGADRPGPDATAPTPETDLHPEDDEINPKIFKIKRASLLEWDLTENGKEEIWFDKPQEIILKKGGVQPNHMMLKLIQFQRDDLKRKTTILRKVNPSDCNFKPIGNQNIFLHWGIFAESFDSSILKKLNATDDEVIIRRSHLYNEIDRNSFEETNVGKARIGFGHRLMHLIDFHDVPDSKF